MYVGVPFLNSTTVCTFSGIVFIIEVKSGYTVASARLVLFNRCVKLVLLNQDVH